MSNQYSFDKGVDIPATSTRQGVNIDLLRAMPVGTSLWFSNKEQKKATRFYRVAKKIGITIVIRKVAKDDPRGAGVRMWHVAGRDTDPIAAAERKAVKRRAPAAKAAKKAAKKAVKRPAKSAAGKRKAKARRNAAPVLDAGNGAVQMGG